VFHEKVVDEKASFVILRFLVNPELVFRNAGEAIMLTEIGKFFINASPDVTAIDNPYVQITSFIDLFQVRWLEFWLLGFTLSVLFDLLSHLSSQ
jgi:hypothetical protein